jgi:hypothetical protein
VNGGYSTGRVTFSLAIFDEVDKLRRALKNPSLGSG